MKRFLHFSAAFVAFAATTSSVFAKTIDDEDIVIVEEPEVGDEEISRVEIPEELVANFNYNTFEQSSFVDKETGERVFRWSDKMLKNGLVHRLTYDFYDKEIDLIEGETSESKTGRPWLIVFIRDRFNFEDKQ